MQSKIIWFTVAVLCAGIILKASAAKLLCGSRLRPYDSSTHHCENGTVKIIKYSACGIPPIKINMRTHKCVNGFPELINEISTPPSTTQRGNPSPRNVCRLGHLHEGEACCQNRVYRPANETCCIITQSYYEVLRGAENKHICCPDPKTMTSKLYKRGSPDVPCQHASSNNKLLREGKSLKKIGLDRCKSFNYVFRLEVIEQMILPENSFLDLRIWGWTTSTKKGHKSLKLSPLETGYSNHVQAELDRYIPEGRKYVKRNILQLKKKRFLIITKQNYAKDAVFYLNPDEVLFRWPKGRSIRKIRKRIKRRCKYLTSV